jgi:hypothetical protein
VSARRWAAGSFQGRGFAGCDALGGRKVDSSIPDGRIAGDCQTPRRIQRRAIAAASASSTPGSIPFRS